MARDDSPSPMLAGAFHGLTGTAAFFLCVVFSQKKAPYYDGAGLLISLLFIQRVGNHVVTTIRRLTCTAGRDQNVLFAGFR